MKLNREQRFQEDYHSRNVQIFDQLENGRHTCIHYSFSKLADIKTTAGGKPRNARE